METDTLQPSKPATISDNTFFHTGDLGDAIASLAAVETMGGGKYILGEKYEGQRESLRGERYHSLSALLRAQPCISSVEWSEADKLAVSTKDFSTFRKNYVLHGNLATQQARHIGVEISLEPWLSAPNPVNHGIAVIARSQRYHNPQFPWRRILGAYRERIFVGLLSEHRSLENDFGSIEYYPTKDLLELARVIAGASIVITNQTCAWWLAAGLGKTCIQETYHADMNSVIERPNLVYTRTASEINVLLDNLP